MHVRLLPWENSDFVGRIFAPAFVTVWRVFSLCCSARTGVLAPPVATFGTSFTCLCLFLFAVLFLEHMTTRSLGVATVQYFYALHLYIVVAFVVCNFWCMWSIFLSQISPSHVTLASASTTSQCIIAEFRAVISYHLKVMPLLSVVRVCCDLLPKLISRYTELEIVSTSDLVCRSFNVDIVK